MLKLLPVSQLLLPKACVIIEKIASLTDSLTVCRQMPCGRETEKASLEFGERQSACPFWPLSQNERGDKLWYNLFKERL
ncbi:hypothetical protein [Acutalibacter sp.]|jgi:hypothetical protein|uniref:hypothetical protein n=1 Tax=Acutalibacter sp. TaxID=1918636 RepID=UPI0034DF6F4B